MNISNLKHCSNCGACYNICPKGAISVDEKGTFYTPIVDDSLCINCSICTKVCPVNTNFEGNKPIYACGGWHKDDNVVSNSSSGGVFYGLAQKVLSLGGVVFSAVYSDDNKKVIFASSDDIPLNKMLKSKYVESSVGFNFQRIKNELEKKRNVLFCGTPCQVAGLVRYLGKEYDSLITCDFACGGVPSHMIYHNYLSELEKKYGSRIISVDFRPKTHGWKRYSFRIRFENGKEYIRLGTEDPYLRSFLYGKFTVRDYCLDCKFSVQHASDISIADFWLFEKLSDLKHDNGISLVLCNTQKGKNILDSIGESYVFSKLDLEKASYNNKPRSSEKRKSKHDDFIKLYEEKGLSLACKKFIPLSAKDKLKNLFVRRFL